MGQQGSVVIEPEAKTFLPWKDAALACLPERAGFMKQHDFSIEVSGLEATRADPLAVDAKISECPSSWDNVFYILSVGRGSQTGLPPECIPSLVAILEGGKVTTRWLCEAAMMALARLYAGQKDPVISEIITDVWESHEISNVRDLALLCLSLIDYKENLMYCEAMKDIDKITNESKVWQFCPSEVQQKLKPPAKIHWPQYDDLLSGHQSMRARAFAIFRLQNTPASELGQEWKQVFGNLIEIVLSNVVDDRLVLQAALAAVSAHAAEFEKQENSRLRKDILVAAQDIRMMCVFREGRKAAENVLKLFKDPFTTVFELFPGKPSNIEREDLKEKLNDKFGVQLRALSDEPMQVMEEYGGDFEKVWDEEICDPTGKLSMETTGVYEVVMLYYLVLNIEEMELHHLQMLIASSNMFERYIGMVHIGIAGLIKHYGIVQNVSDNESVSDVRNCADVVLAKLKDMAKSSDHLGEKKAAGIQDDWGKLMKLERQALVKDFPSVTGARNEDEVTEYLKGFGL